MTQGLILPNGKILGANPQASADAVAFSKQLDEIVGSMPANMADVAVAGLHKYIAQFVTPTATREQVIGCLAMVAANCIADHLVVLESEPGVAGTKLYFGDILNAALRNKFAARRANEQAAKLGKMVGSA